MKIIPYGHQWIRSEDIQSVVRTLNSDYLTQGPRILEFEKKLASYVGAKYAVAFNSGTAALHSAYFAVGLRESDCFITTPLTFAATANAGLYLGAKPIFVDIEPRTGNIDVSKIEKNLNTQTKLIVPVHYSGNPVDLEPIYKLSKKHKLHVVEDASHALGARCRNEKIGSCKYSDITVFSFHPVKHITTGEGGAAITNSEEYYQKMLMFRTHGITKDKNLLENKNEGGWYYEMQYLGYNYRLTDMQAALGISQLKKIETFVKKRRLLAKHYDRAFAENAYVDTVKEEVGICSSYHLYPLLLKESLIAKKKEIFAALKKKGIGVQVHYIPLYQHPYYQKIGYENTHCPEAEKFYKKEISIPMYASLKNSDADFVINTLNTVIKNI